jgi:GDPmannose 4,6-dehydratase
MIGNAKTALIFGISGQDGTYLARLLLDKGYDVYGTSRDAGVSTFSKLEKVGIRRQVHLLSAVPTDFRSVMQAISRVEPSEVYNLGGPSSVGLSFEHPVDTFESMAVGTLNILEAMRMIGGPIRFYNACSSECFGDTGTVPANERTAFSPRSPYAVAKAAAFWLVANYRDAYGPYACSGILFNHDSPLRPKRFVTRKIVAAAARIAAEGGGELVLGNLDVQRDWGWAPEYVDAMWRMLQQEKADDYVIATGESHALRDFVAETFAYFDLDWREHVRSDPILLRPADIDHSRGDASKAHRRLGWKAETTMADVVRRMAEAEVVLTRGSD